MKTVQKGDITELRVAADLIARGLIVLKPMTEDCRYDLVVEEDGKYTRVQCKTGKLNNGVIVVGTCSCHTLTHEKTSYLGQAEVFGIYCFETDTVYYVKVADAGTKRTHLRVAPPANCQMDRVRFASDHLEWIR